MGCGKFISCHLRKENNFWIVDPICTQHGKAWVYPSTGGGFAIPLILAKDAEKQFDKDYKKCKEVFQKCSKLEDEALEYMINCYTSASTIKANVVELLKIKDACTKLKTNQEAVVSTSKESKRQKRGKSSEVVTCSVYITEVETLNTVKFIQIIVENLKLWI